MLRNVLVLPAFRANTEMNVADERHGAGESVLKYVVDLMREIVPGDFAGQLPDEPAFDASLFHRQIVARRDLNRIFTRRAVNRCQSGVSEGVGDVPRLMEPFFARDARAKSLLQTIGVDVGLDDLPRSAKSPRR